MTATANSTFAARAVARGQQTLAPPSFNGSGVARRCQSGDGDDRHVDRLDGHREAGGRLDEASRARRLALSSQHIPMPGILFAKGITIRCGAEMVSLEAGTLTFPRFRRNRHLPDCPAYVRSARLHLWDRRLHDLHPVAVGHNRTATQDPVSRHVACITHGETHASACHSHASSRSAWRLRDNLRMRTKATFLHRSTTGSISLD